jgi:hypothetical protein
MTPWLVAIDKLQSLGYSIMLTDGKLRYTYRGKDAPPQNEITHLFEVVKAHKQEILNDPYFLIEQTLEEINGAWIPGILEWMGRSQPTDWKRLLALEAMINKRALSGDAEGIGTVLEDYRHLLQRMTKAFSSMGKQTNLFDTLKKGDKPDEGTNHCQV